MYFSVTLAGTAKHVIYVYTYTDLSEDDLERKSTQVNTVIRMGLLCLRVGKR